MIGQWEDRGERRQGAERVIEWDSEGKGGGGGWGLFGGGERGKRETERWQQMDCSLQHTYKG